jgi:hypothetical protein
MFYDSLSLLFDIIILVRICDHTVLCVLLSRLYICVRDVSVDSATNVMILLIFKFCDSKLQISAGYETAELQAVNKTCNLCVPSDGKTVHNAINIGTSIVLNSMTLNYHGFLCERVVQMARK